ncbi:FAD/NAD(P)-binding protein [Sinorhizobium numidicum]|uniref:FAD/NAD(P)-binding protein n=1 Tax=Sinorhizobium numidicum TaxID=680248 RepID=A0ABY8CNN4_9HYPH|nr:FAD/NAD(P)-binding protein [Sinorhizobium numidicum]WEX73792.1 FAD/NAD(P)-binding protein [Sinorhizobium numidicum]WEX79777.1 FAD/NAD(P)-binding protein [Sinorhizobium numidicum]
MTVHGLFATKPPAAASLSSKPEFAIVGRGFSGIMMAIALMKSVRVSFQLTMYDPHPSINGGQALSSAQSLEILNSRVRDLSVAAGQPDDFNDWLCANDEFRAAVPAAIPGFRQIFVPKGIFSDYVHQRFSEALARRSDITVKFSHEPVLALRKLSTGRFTLVREGGNDECDVVVLATGFGVQPRNIEISGDETPVVRARRLVDPRHAVLLGSGIRVVDRLFQLRDNGYAGRITLLSRHGFLPQTHTRLAAAPSFPVDPMPVGLRQIVRFVRQACADAEASGQGWQSAMNGLRRRARSLWQSLSPQEKRQFNRHLRAIYDSHRNRLPAAVHARLQQELADGRTVLCRGWAGRRLPEGLMVRWAGQSSEELLRADQVIDCRCSAPDLAAPLFRSLFAGGLAMTDELELGLAVSPTGEVLAEGGRTPNLFAIGPLGLGSLPDIDLVPEIVTQTYAAARLIATGKRPALKAG